MKKHLRLVFLLIVIVALFIAAPRSVLACGPSTPEETVWTFSADGITGTEVPMSSITSVPRTWLSLMSNGIKVDGATQICQNFDKGRYGWVGIYYKLVNGSWVKLPTTSGWTPDEEGQYMVCTKATSAGTYALFGYWTSH